MKRRLAQITDQAFADNQWFVPDEEPSGELSVTRAE